ncbi:MAG: tetratricopeptide repeat protein [Deltaproteobacteria bacterium]|nr:tetratricopeptide repeat protein [Deltaproteobacteria bacterium]MBI4223804.1 tetratricopeptide repeat protein [Deltaproteobacteria bacterium]
MTMGYSWIRDVLMRDPNWQGGIDLNQDGEIQPEETIQNYNGDGMVGDPGDWGLFAANNAQALRRRVAFFGWSAPFKKDNPIHELLAIESEMVSPEEIKQAYAFAERVLTIVRARLNDGQHRTNQEKVQLVYQVMKDVEVHFIAQGDDSLFATNVKRKQLDCDTSSFAALAVGHEPGWPLSLVPAPQHVFVRWEGEGERFNVDEGVISPDSYYVDWLKISKESLEAGVYLASQSHSQILALFFYNRGVTKGDLGRFAEAIEDYDKALALDPKFVQAYISRGVAKHWPDHYAEGIEDYDQAIALDPKHTRAYNNRGFAKAKLSHWEEAIEDFEAALRIDPNYMIARQNLEWARARLKP